jgi:AraC-like DNA-binding protein
MTSMIIKKSIERPMPSEIGRQSTLLAAWAVVIHRLLEHRGIDANALFTECGIDRELLLNPANRIPHHQIGKVWQRAGEITNDPSLGLDAAEVIFPGMYHTLSAAIYAAPNILTMLEYLSRYRRIFHPLSRMELQRDGRCFRFHWGPKEPYVSHFGAEAVVAAFIGLCRQLGGADFAPSEIHIKRQLNPSAQRRYKAFYRAPLYCSQPENTLVFAPGPLEKPLLTSNSVIEKLSVQATREYIATLDEEDICNTVYCKIIEALPARAYGEEMIAQDLHLSVRTMQRRLKDAGTSYDRLLQDTRRELALNYIRNQDLSLQEISYLVGFTKPTNFTRAFKRWTGQTPGAYREGR